MSNAVLKVPNGIGVGVEVSSTIPLPVEIFVALESVIAVDRDEKLDAIAVRLDHELVKAVQHSVIP